MLRCLLLRHFKLIEFGSSKYSTRNYKRLRPKLTPKLSMSKLTKSRNLRSVKYYKRNRQCRQYRHEEKKNDDMVWIYAQVGLCYFIANTYVNNYFNINDSYYANSNIHDDPSKDMYFTHGLSDNDFHTKMLNNIVSATIWPLSSIHYSMPLIISFIYDKPRKN